MPDPLIRIENLYKVFGTAPQTVMDRVREGQPKDDILAETGHTVGLKEINLTIERGQIFVIMGLSGSGKSTLIRHLNRLIDPTEGKIIVGDVDVMQLDQKELQEFRRHKMSMVFQRFGLMPHRTVLQNVAYGLKVQGTAKKERKQKRLTGWKRSVSAAMANNIQCSFPAVSSSGLAWPAPSARMPKSC